MTHHLPDPDQPTASTSGGEDRRTQLGHLAASQRRFDRRSVVSGAAAAAAMLGSGQAPARPSPARAGQAEATPVPDQAEPLITVVREPRPREEGTPRPGGRLRLLRSPFPTGDFHPAAFRQDYQVAVSYLDPLLRPDPITLTPTPWLAESWVWGDDGRSLRFRLRPSLRWHDGSPLTAADVAFSFTVYRDDVESAVRNFFAGMTEIEALDDLTLRVTLAEPDGGWLFNAATQLVFQRAQYLDHWTARPLGERTLADYDWKENPPLGSGPWRLTGWDDASVEFERWEQYWAGAPHFERLTIGWRPTPADRLRAWEEGDNDAVWPIRPAEVARLSERRGRLFAVDAASVMFAAFNFDNPERAAPDLFADVQVRRALSLAIDRPRYARQVFDGFIAENAAGTVAQPWARDLTLSTAPRNPRQARRLLAEAGWEDRDDDDLLENPDGVPFAITAIFLADGRPELARVLTSAAVDLAVIGVELTVEPLPEPEFSDRWRQGRDYDLIAFAYDLYPGFTDFDLYGSAWDIRINRQGWNPGGYANTVVDASIADALVAVDLDDQRAALVRLQQAVEGDLFALWLGFPQALVLLGEDVRGFEPNKLWQTADTRLWWRAPED